MLSEKKLHSSSDVESIVEAVLLRTETYNIKSHQFQLSQNKKKYNHIKKHLIEL